MTVISRNHKSMQQQNILYTTQSNSSTVTRGSGQTSHAVLLLGSHSKHHYVTQKLFVASDTHKITFYLGLVFLILFLQYQHFPSCLVLTLVAQKKGCAAKHTVTKVPTEKQVPHAAAHTIR